MQILSKMPEEDIYEEELLVKSLDVWEVRIFIFSMF